MREKNANRSPTNKPFPFNTQRLKYKTSTYIHCTSLYTHCMLLSRTEQHFFEAVHQVCYANPFTDTLAEAEQKALGSAFVETPAVWSLDIRDPFRQRENSWRLAEKTTLKIEAFRLRLLTEHDATPHELELYEAASFLTLYYRYYAAISDAVFGPKPTRNRWAFYRDFARDFDHFFAIPNTLPGGYSAVKVFALFVQIVRSFLHIFENVLGSGKPAGRLRAAIWQSLFTHDLRRYGRHLSERMGEFATLITGPSGTGKEVVARTIATCRYQPFDDKTLSFPHEAEALFLPINIAALTPTLVESELFGHRRGAFTGAMGDRKGYLEACPALGGVFLDELGEMSLEVQVKLLRVIESRQFTPVGDTTSKRFAGKLLAATNRNLSQAIAEGRFREDLYFRLCSDILETPSLRSQLEESPQVLEELVRYMAFRSGGDETFTQFAIDWVSTHLKHYAWPGNYRELEQCVRNLLIRGEYRPPNLEAKTTQPQWLSAANQGQLTADDLLTHYCRHVHQQTGTYEATAAILGIDRRTVRARIA